MAPVPSFYQIPHKIATDMEKKYKIFTYNFEVTVKHTLRKRLQILCRCFSGNPSKGICVSKCASMEMIVLSLPARGNNASGIEPGDRLIIRCQHLCRRINYVGFVGHVAYIVCVACD